MKKSIFLGIITGILLAGSIGASAMTYKPTGYLYTKNPIYSAPKGYAETIGPNGTISAKCTVTKSGYTTKSVYASTKSSCQVETDWVSGPTYKSSGTTFTSNHTGYNADGAYWTGYAKKSY
ncbi:MAG: hypothetical protein K1W00_05080 [Lachnospiraceae bacterium]